MPSETHDPVARIRSALRANRRHAAAAAVRKAAERRAELCRLVRGLRGFAGSTLRHPFLKPGATLR
jgi:hypothetical protein